MCPALAPRLVVRTGVRLHRSRRPPFSRRREGVCAAHPHHGSKLMATRAAAVEVVYVWRPIREGKRNRSRSLLTRLVIEALPPRPYCAARSMPSYPLHLLAAATSHRTPVVNATAKEALPTPPGFYVGRRGRSLARGPLQSRHRCPARLLRPLSNPVLSNFLQGTGAS